MERRKFIHTAAMSSLGLMTLGGSSCALLKIQKEISFGHGTHKYRVKNDWSWASFSRYPIKDAHEMVQVKDGRFFLLTNETRNNIIIFDESGQLIDTWGDSFPGGHGLTLSDEGGEEFLYITDHDLHKVFKTDLKGNVVLTLEAPLDSDSYSSKDVFKPTETTISSDGSIYVADGYGAQWITVFNQDGTIKNQFGGPEFFQTAHGICIDDRNETPSLLITARDQQMLRRFSMNGVWMEDVQLNGAHINRPVIHGDNVYLSVLKSSNFGDRGSGFVMILDKENKVISCPGGSDPNYTLEQTVPFHQTTELFVHPHDVCVDKNENLYIPQWNSGGIYPIMLERI